MVTVWDDWKMWEWMHLGWMGIRMHPQCAIRAPSRLGAAMTVRDDWRMWEWMHLGWKGIHMLNTYLH